MSGPTLDELAKAGQAAREATKREARAQIDEQLGARASEARRSTSPLGMFAGNGAAFLLVCLAIPTAIMVIYGLAVPMSHYRAHQHPNPAIWIGQIGAAITGTYLLIIVLARLHVPASVRAETAWLEALPFALVDHTKLLGNYRSSFTIEFAAATPPRELFLLALDGAKTATEKFAVGSTDDPPFSVDVTCPVVGSPRARWRTSRRLVATLLVPLHERFPITAVRFR